MPHMTKILALMLMLTTSYAFSKDYVLVGVSGYGTGENGKGQPSAAHYYLPPHKRIVETHKLVHQVSSKDLDALVESLNCREPNAPGLIIMANSWGSTQAHKLSVKYEELCGTPVDLFIMIDGVKKPIGPFKKTPVANKCINYYQRKSTIKGGPIEGCDNYDLSATCEKAKVAACHIDIEWLGGSKGASDIYDFLFQNR